MKGSLALFSVSGPRNVQFSFIDKKDVSDANSFLTGKIFRITDRTNRFRQVLLDFDLAGRILAVSLLSDDFLPVKLFDRSFQGTYIVYKENCKNLFHEERVNYYYDYYQEATSTDSQFAERLYRKIHAFVCSLQGICAEYEQILRLITSYEWEVLEEEKRKLLSVYSTPISVVPPEVRPDQNPVFAFIQISTGCWTHALKRGPCAFCASYLGQAFREKPLSEVSAHIDMVKAYCGPAWQAVRKVFLLDADPLFTKLSSLEYVRCIREKIDVACFESFVSTPCILSKTVDEWKALVSLGLRKVYWGVESANDASLQILKKPHTSDMLYRAVEVLHAAGLDFVVIVMSGIGLFHDSNAHIVDTGRFIANGRCPAVDISKFQALHGTHLHQQIEQGALPHLAPERIEEEHRLLIREISVQAPQCYVRGAYGRQFL